MNSNSYNNACTCLSYINQALLSMQNNGEITAPESQYIAQYINSSPANREQFCQSVTTTFGENQATNDQLWQFTVNKMRSAVTKLRQNRMNAMPQYGVNPFGQNQFMGQPQYGMNMGMMQQPQFGGMPNQWNQPMQQQGFGYQPSMNGGFQSQMQSELNSIYGTRVSNPTFNTTPVQNQSNYVQQNAEPKQVQADSCTHQPYVTDDLEEAELVRVEPRYSKMSIDEIPVKRKPIETTNKNGESIRKKPVLEGEELIDVHAADEPLWGEWYKAEDEMSDSTVKLSEADVPGIKENAEDALNDLSDSSNDEVFMGNFAYVVSYNEAIALDCEYDKGVGYWNMCYKAFRSARGPKGVLALLKQIEQLPLKLNSSLTKLILEEWNKNSEMNFTRINVDGSITRIGTFESLNDIKEMMVDEHPNQLADWKANKTAYLKALQTTIDGSLGRIFHTKRFKYLDPMNKLDKCCIINAAKSKLKVGNQRLNNLMFINPNDVKTMSVIDNAVKNVFVPVIERRILVTNLKFLDEYESNKSELLDIDKLDGKIILSLLRKRGNLQIVDPSRASTLEHPNYSGCMYDGEVLVRRKI